ncbi:MULTISPECIES: hypothetical protein [unclassified Proteiniphilum]|jgi:uncharacterized protein YneF (UPF0154 family)|uniref:hypothetical protein n=1 Tax=unclassified Proteiniphilum TaxID=2622718 RepID=UPI00257BD334|nr:MULTISPECIES: hypothetical protein [unclassified Proteiniphilum]
MVKKRVVVFLVPLLAAGILLGGYSCTSPSEDYVTEQELRSIIREELRGYLTQEQIIQLISNSIPPNVSEERIRQIITEELKGALTPAQIDQIIQAVGQGLTEAQIREIIKQEVEKAATGWKIVNINVKKEDWKWNDEVAQYEVFFNFPELTEFIYEDGATIGYVFIGTQGVDEVQKPLPFVNTYSTEIDETGNPIATFTETISYDVQYKDNGKSTVAFIIKDSQLAKDLDAPQNYNFRIVLIW